jgi:hypothetical protein
MKDDDLPIRGAKLFVDQRLAAAGRPQPVARWLGVEWTPDVRREVHKGSPLTDEENVIWLIGVLLRFVVTLDGSFDDIARQFG